MKIGRKQFFFVVLPLGLVLWCLLFPASITQDQTLVWIQGDEKGGEYVWQDMADESSDDSHTLYLQLPVTKLLFFRMPPDQGAHGIALLPGSPPTRWRNSGLHRNGGQQDWVYPRGGWRPTRAGTYIFYCPLHPRMMVRVIVSRSGKPNW